MSDVESPVSAPTPLIADPAPLGLGGFALTTFVLSVHNANWAPDYVWVGLALFYGGLSQFMAGMHEFRNRNTFGSTAFTSYGAFWLSLATFMLLIWTKVIPTTGTGAIDVFKALGFFVLAFAIFNTYMLLWSTRVSAAVFTVFLTLEITEILLFVGFFLLSGGHLRAGNDIVHFGGYVGVATAAAAWYASAAGVVNSMAGRPVLKVGSPLWTDTPAARPAARMVTGTPPVPQT